MQVMSSFASKSSRFKDPEILNHQIYYNEIRDKKGFKLAKSQRFVPNTNDFKVDAGIYEVIFLIRIPILYKINFKNH